MFHVKRAAAVALSCTHCVVLVACGIGVSIRTGPVLLSVALHSAIGAVIHLYWTQAAYRRFLRYSLSATHGEICPYKAPHQAAARCTAKDSWTSY